MNKKLLTFILYGLCISNVWAMDDEFDRTSPALQRYNIVLVEESANRLALYEYDNQDVKNIGRNTGSISLSRWPHEVAISSDGRVAYVSNFGIRDYDSALGDAEHSISIIDLENQCEVDRLYTIFNGQKFWAPHGVKITPDGKYLFTNVERAAGSRYANRDESLFPQKAKMLVFDLKERRPVAAFGIKRKGERLSLSSDSPLQSFDILPGAHNFIFTLDGQSIWYYSGSTGITKIDLQGNILVRQTNFNGAVRSLSFNSDGNILVSANNELSIVSPKDGSIIKKHGDLGVSQLLYSKETPDRNYVLAPAVWESQVLVVSLQDGSVVKRLPTGINPIQVVITPDKKSAFVTHGKSNWLSEINLQDFSITREIQTQGGPNGIGFAPIFNLPSVQELTVGVCLPFTGRFASEARECRLGLQYWQDKVNASGGVVVGGQKYRFDVVYQDTLSSTHPEELKKTGKLLFNTDKKVSLMLGSYPSSTNKPLAAVAYKKRVPFITSTGRNPDLFESELDNVFSLLSKKNVNHSSLATSVEAILSTYSPKPATAIILSSNDKDSLEESNAVSGFLSSHRITVLNPTSPTGKWSVNENNVLVYDPKHLDASSMTKELRDSYPDLLLLAGYREEFVKILKSSAVCKFTPGALIINEGLLMAALHDKLGQCTKGLLGSASWSRMTTDFSLDRFGASSDFSQGFYAIYNEYPSEYAAGFVASGVIIEEALRRSSNMETETLIQAFRGLTLSTFFGLVSFADDGANKIDGTMALQLIGTGKNIQESVIWPLEHKEVKRPIFPSTSLFD